MHKKADWDLGSEVELFFGMVRSLSNFFFSEGLRLLVPKTNTGVAMKEKNL